MKQFVKAIVLIMALATTLLSCKKDHVEDPNHTNYKSDLQQFEAVWNGLNTAYVLWHIDNTDWDAIHEQYSPIFEKMEVQNDSVWAATWKDLTSTLIDHHLNINLERPSSGLRISINPGMNEVMNRSYFHLPMGEVKRTAHLLQLQLNGRLTNVSNIIETEGIYYSGILDDEIAYFYGSSFRIEGYNSFLVPFLHFKELVANQNIKAAIIDIRDNVGGIALIPDLILSCFTSETPTIGNNQTKIGLGRYELGPQLPYQIGLTVAKYDRQDRDIPVIALTNIFSASASEITALAIKHLHQGYVVGERTFGATCTLSNEFGLFYSGSFGDSQEENGNWTGHGHFVYTPKYLFTGVDGTIYEGHGVDPDVECLFDQSTWSNWVDNQLECAIGFAKNKIAENGN